MGSLLLGGYGFIPSLLMLVLLGMGYLDVWPKRNSIPMEERCQLRRTMLIVHSFGILIWFAVALSTNSGAAMEDDPVLYGAAAISFWVFGILVLLDIYWLGYNRTETN